MDLAQSKTAILSRLREFHDELSLIDSDRRFRDQVDDQTVDAIGSLLSDLTDLVDPALPEDAEHPADPHKQMRLIIAELMDRTTQIHTQHAKVRNLLDKVITFLQSIAMGSSTLPPTDFGAGGGTNHPASNAP
ncbi:MAG TPA: hypothetical protein PKD64_10865 [Pirellulaceae bacterium]|nr:hypothetical protein [Pirellulaceae bacterium]HMO92683.1 hypothetical protein [Pirellulaceae bacterium]HMP70569.1 hypothetical protein [Pirellulaceae bacterium]